MATQTSKVDAALNALQTQLAALAGLSGVTVASGDLAANTPRDAVVFFGVEDWQQTWGAIGNLRKDETFTAPGLVKVVEAGAGETAIRAARARAFAITGAIETYLRSSIEHGDAVSGITLQGVVKRATYTPARMVDLLHADGHMCVIEFGIEIVTQLTRGA